MTRSNTQTDLLTFMIRNLLLIVSILIAEKTVTYSLRLILNLTDKAAQFLQVACKTNHNYENYFIFYFALFSKSGLRLTIGCLPIVRSVIRL